MKYKNIIPKAIDAVTSYTCVHIAVFIKIVEPAGSNYEIKKIKLKILTTNSIKFKSKILRFYT